MFDTRKKDQAFFGAFTEHAGRSVEAAETLVRMFDRLQPAEPRSSGAYDAATATAADVDAAELRELATKIKALETAGDTITHDTMKRLHANWITPLDRNDIHSLISRMDDVLDFIEEASERLVLFEVRSAPSQALALARILEASCRTLGRAIALLPTMKRAKEILDLCVEVNRLENEADQIHRKAIADLFRPGNDPLVVMKWRDIFDSLESAADRCEDVANVLEGVVLEYA